MTAKSLEGNGSGAAASTVQGTKLFPKSETFLKTAVASAGQRSLARHRFGFGLQDRTTHPGPLWPRRAKAPSPRRTTVPCSAGALHNSSAHLTPHRKDKLSLDGFFDLENLIRPDVGQLLDGPPGPLDFDRLNQRLTAQTKVQAAVAGRHETHTGGDKVVKDTP